MSQFIRVLATFFVSLLCLNTLANETVTFYHHDALGSTIAATDANGDTLWTEEYTPYGNRIENKNNAANPFWYTGKQEEMGLNYFQARWYDPKLGRFLSPDPVEFNAANLQSFNRYAYANNNPYMYIDPDGNVAIKLITLGLDFVDFSAAMVAGNYADAGLTLLTMADPTGLGTLARRAAKAKKIADKASVTKAAGKLPPLRQAYVDEVAGLSSKAAQMRKAGSSSEDIARALNAERRNLGVKYKELTPGYKRLEIYTRNIQKYGDKLGPSIDYLRNVKGKSWEQIIESASRSGGKDLGF